jgi:hypothetical protein
VSWQTLIGRWLAPGPPRTEEAAASPRADAEQAAALKAAVNQVKALDVDDARKSALALQRAMRRQIVRGRAMPVSRPPQVRAAARVLHRLAHIASAGRPILVGPWTGDVGLELLYWVPFVRWFALHYRLPASQFHVVSRGGAPWYADLAGTYTDILSLCSESDYRTARARTRTSLCGFERGIVRRVCGGAAERPMLLHPALMTRLFTPYWSDDASIEQVARYTLPRPLQPPSCALPPLPHRFVAVQFAFGPEFPDTAANRAWIDRTVASLAQSGDVVWLGAGLDAPHAAGEYTPPLGARVHRVDQLLVPAQAMAMQAAILSRAHAFVGAYGGLSFVAPFYGVTSVAFYSTRGFFPHHRGVAEHMLGRHDRQSLIVLDVADSALLRRLTDASGNARPSAAARVP